MDQRIDHAASNGRCDVGIPPREDKLSCAGQIGMPSGYGIGGRCRGTRDTGNLSRLSTHGGNGISFAAVWSI